MSNYIISFCELHQYIKDNKGINDSINNILDKIAPYLLDPEKDYGQNKTLYKRIKDDEKKKLNYSDYPHLNYEKGKEILEIIHDHAITDAHRTLTMLAPKDNYENRTKLKEGDENGDAQKGEIQIIERSTENLIEPKYKPVNKYVEVYIDDVLFIQNRGNEGDPQPYEGRYIRIEPGTNKETGTKNPGAVVLPIDLEQEKVLLITQYRHPQRDFLTEAPRGFGSIAVPEEEKETAQRELLEETGFVPTKDGMKGEGIQPLKKAYTDTGKLTEAPGIFLAYVDQNTQNKQYLQNRPTMQDPCWFDLYDFYKAVFQIDPKEHVRIPEPEFALETARRDYIANNTPVDDGKLHICDLFTTSAALLAFPIISNKLKEQGKIDGDEDPIVTHRDGSKKKFKPEEFI